MPNRTGIDSQVLAPIDLEILTGVEHVEAADPQADGQTEQPWLPSRAAAGGKPSTNRGNRHREPEK